MSYRYPNLELDPDETLLGFFPYPTAMTTKKGFHRITFQSATKRYNVYLSSVVAGEINALEPPISPDDIVEARGTKSGVRLRLLERGGWRRLREKKRSS